jgi:zinc transport system ATP-binding protein
VTSPNQPVTPLIRVENASFGYDGRVVVPPMSFSVEEGDYLCIAGVNGAGKSTLLKGLLRLMKPLQGTVTYDAAVAREPVGYLAQAAEAKKDFPAGVFEIVLSGHLGRMGLRPFYTPGERRAAEENLARLGIADLKGACYRELSGGQQRRVLIARSLCAAGKLLFLDEPLAGLDAPAAAGFLALLQSINRDIGVTVVMVSHDAAAMETYGNKIIRLGK